MSSACCKRGNASIPIKSSSSKCTSFNVLPEHSIHHRLVCQVWAPKQYAPWPRSSSVFYFTFSGDAGGRVGGGGRVPACSGLFAPGCRFGNNRGGEGVEIRGVDDVTHLVLSL